MEFEIIDETAAPQKPREMTKSSRKSLDLINQLTPGKVGKITAPDPAAIRSLKLSLARVGAANGKKVDVWSDDQYVYVKLA